ncbi:MAG TPA: hypothetical protein DG814_10340 [Synechococcus sp. UBA9887]|nr:MAG: hypothetical protein DBW84_03825 [Synechococcus sp. MED-G70]HCX54682.1 hypothetical protein [Synechococcus sp. UBA9887]
METETIDGEWAGLVDRQLQHRAGARRLLSLHGSCSGDNSCCCHGCTQCSKHEIDRSTN